MVVTGHYGWKDQLPSTSPLTPRRRPATARRLADMDVVNPYSPLERVPRDLLEGRVGSSRRCSAITGTSLDVLSVTGELAGRGGAYRDEMAHNRHRGCRRRRWGATTLARFAPAILAAGPYAMLYVVNVSATHADLRRCGAVCAR